MVSHKNINIPVFVVVLFIQRNFGIECFSARFFFLSASMCLVIVVLAGLFPPLHYSGLIVLTGRQAHNQLHKSLWSVVCLYYLFSVLYNISPPPKCSPSPLNIRTHTAHTNRKHTHRTHTHRSRLPPESTVTPTTLQ